MDEIDVPTFLCKGEKIVEVMYSRWGEVYPSEWRLLDQSRFVVLDEAIDRVVFELPTGCYNFNLVGGTKDISFRPTPDGELGMELSRCVRPHGYEQAMREQEQRPAVSSAQLDIEDRYPNMRQ